ncbi:FAD-binding oxidoreductase [Marinilabiliaceae bacterium JC017]|nr:FAD-binding oxidoreductase [Marinilabiliaceae bacterium JC017]
MDDPLPQHSFDELKSRIKGDLFLDETSKLLYATDASAYFEKPLGVVRPRDARDVEMIIRFANKYKIPLIPRTAGTSLAGQVVGNGLVVDTGRYMNKILELNQEQRWVRVEPGVVLDELNQYLEPYGLFFGPETSTSNRCMIGGMVGNNSCGAHSILYGSTRDHTCSVSGFLSNGDEVTFKDLQKREFEKKCRKESFEGDIYRQLRDVLTNKENRRAIKKEFPHPDIHRRNTGYALDMLKDVVSFKENGEPFNMCKLLAGSEGTLMFTTEITLNLVPLPPSETGLVCVHLKTLEEAIEANLVALKFEPGAVELMDKTVLELTKGNALQRKNRFFLQGEPEALLLVEFARHTKNEIVQIARDLEAVLREKGYGYAFPVLFGKDIKKVWALRKAGLGVLANMPGDERPVPVIEDTAVRPKDLPAYVVDIKQMLSKYKKECVYYAHIGSGELHLRPVLNMKKEADVELFHQIAEDTAHIVKKYRGSLSGEHGDGRLRGQFIPLMVGEHNYALFRQVKSIFDPNNILNPGKITDTPRMNSSLRYKQVKREVINQPVFSWEKTQGLVRAAEKCSGSGDCRKSHLIGGTMCPSYMGTRDEKHSTRGRANMLREFFAGTIPADKMGYEEVKGVLDLCLSCKACKSECPSNVDMTKLKAEFYNHYHNQFGIPLRSRLIAWLPVINKYTSSVPYLYNIGVNSLVLKRWNSNFLGFSSKRAMPEMNKLTLVKWFKRHDRNEGQRKSVYLFADEFTNYNDSDIGIKATLLLEKLGYDVKIPNHVESGRTCLSKGLLKRAKKLAEKNVTQLHGLVSEDMPLIGIEPSGILTFRDEYPELVSDQLKDKAKALAKNCFTIEEFMSREFEAGNILSDKFSQEEKKIRFHAHCYQKALSDPNCTKKILEIPANYSAEEIPSGCCGMAGAFGYEKEHYDLSMRIGELVLFPEVRNTPESFMVVAAGTSCRHQIKDGTGREALHPVNVLYDALL